MRGFERTDSSKCIRKDNRGSGLVMVMVIMAFLGILSGILMFASYGGYKMRIAEKVGKNNFYTAESVLDEINTGLQTTVSKVLSETYLDVMQNYSLYETPAKRNQKMYDMYYEGIQKELQLDDAHPTLGKISVLKDFLSEQSRGDGDFSRANFQTYGAIVEAPSSSKPTEYFDLVLEPDKGLLLKGIEVTYVDERGAVAIINTDIRIAMPDFNFSDSAAFPDLNNFCLISNGRMTAKNTVAGKEILVNGNAYAKEIVLNNGPEEGLIAGSNITFGPSPEEEEDENSLVICEKDIQVNKGKLKTDRTELWASNIILNSSDADLSGDTYVKNDLVLEGTDCTASLTGAYTGFGMSDEASAKSSAILVNGKKSSLDLSGLDSINICGHAYIGTAHDPEESLEDLGDEVKNVKDILMGESIAVKTDQLVYLVPPEALGCRKSSDGTIGESEFNCNPLSSEQYQMLLKNPSKYLMIDEEKPISDLGGKKLKEYMAPVENLGYWPEVSYKQIGDRTLVYCYMRFASVDSANQYFKDYYGVNTEMLNKYTKLYAEAIKIKDPDQLVHLNLAGNAMAYDGTKSSIRSASGKAKEVLEINRDMSGQFRALCTKLVPGIAQLNTEEQGRDVFNNIINVTRLNEELMKPENSGRLTLETEPSGGAAEGNQVLFVNGDYIVDAGTSDRVKIIVALGNVRVSRDFNGLILAQKDIYLSDEADVDGKVEISSLSLDDFTEALMAKNDDGRVYALDFFRDGVNYASSANKFMDYGTRNISMADLVVYEHWSKK